MTDDRDYTYDELLLRVFAIMRDKNPEMVAGEKKKFVMRPPQVVRVGTKKTAFVNFTEIAKMLVFQKSKSHFQIVLCIQDKPTLNLEKLIVNVSTFQTQIL